LSSQRNTNGSDGGTNARPSATLRGRWLLLARVAWVAVAVFYASLCIASIAVTYVAYPKICGGHPNQAANCVNLGLVDRSKIQDIGLSLRSYTAYTLALDVVHILGFWALGVVIFWKKSDNRMVLFASLMLLLLGSSENHLVDTLIHNYPAWSLSVGITDVTAWLLLYILFFIFPDGRFVPRWTRWLCAAGILYFVYLFLFSPGVSEFYFISTIVVLGGGAIVAQVYRYRRVSGPVERQQAKFVMVAGTIVVGWQLSSSIFEPFLLPRYALFVDVINYLSLLLVPVSIALAVLRYRLWDIDFLINRALLYSILTALVVGIYMLLVGLSSTLLRTEDDLAGSLLAAGIVALLFAPLRNRLQRGVNRLMYGERDDPYTVLTGLGERLETTLAPDAVLPAITEAVAKALKLPYAAIAFKRDDEFVEAAQYGKKEVTGELLSVPLTYQTETVGKLVVAPRVPGEAFGKSDLRLLEDLARQAGVATYAVRLTAELQRSRERLVTAREEERRRLRRDLHDGVGPQLAALMLELESASELVSDDPEASALIAKLSERARGTVSDVRRSVHALRPPALDELGLVEALREVTGQFGRDGLRVSVEAPEELPPLPAAVEVACYRIAQEAMTNVVRHAQASNCWVRLALDEEAGTLSVEVEDDGRGIREDDRVGVGMSSMRERAEELGGKFTVKLIAGGGTLLSALLPFGTTEGAHRREE
jgi:signal transduction histidine kinase